MPGKPRRGPRGKGGWLDSAPPPPDPLGMRGRGLSIDYKVVKIAVPDGSGSAGAPRAAKYGVLAISRSDGLVIFLSNARPGLSTGEAALRAIMPKMGLLSESLEDPDTPPAERIAVNVDRALQEVKKVWPGANVCIPHGGRRASGATGANDIVKSMNSADGRSVLERVFRRIDGYKLVSKTFVGTVDDFDETLQVVSGLINMRIIARAKEAYKKGSGKKGSGKKGSGKKGSGKKGSGKKGSGKKGHRNERRISAGALTPEPSA